MKKIISIMLISSFILASCGDECESDIIFNEEIEESCKENLPEDPALEDLPDDIQAAMLDDNRIDKKIKN
jgi:hypothetical protein